MKSCGKRGWGRDRQSNSSPKSSKLNMDTHKLMLRLVFISTAHDKNGFAVKRYRNIKLLTQLSLKMSLNWKYFHHTGRKILPGWLPAVTKDLKHICKQGGWAAFWNKQNTHLHTRSPVSACLFPKGNQATGLWPGPLAVALSDSCLVFLPAHIFPGFCLSEVSGFTLDPNKLKEKKKKMEGEPGCHTTRKNNQPGVKQHSSTQDECYRPGRGEEVDGHVKQG